MDDATRKAFFVNMLLVANADDGVDDAERGFLRTFVERSGITAGQVAAWTGELRAGRARFVPVDSPERADEALGLMVAVASADGTLGVNERRALLAWGRVMGLERDALVERVRERWGADVLGELFPEPAPAGATPHGARVLVLSEHFERIDAFIEAGAGFDFEVRERAAFTDLPGDVDFVVFHVAEAREASIATLERLRAALPGALPVAVANRHQAFQISYLLEAGVHRCMVEPIYPGELARLVARARES